MALTVKDLPVMQETWVQSLGWEDPLEEGMATHSSILAWRCYLWFLFSLVMNLPIRYPVRYVNRRLMEQLHKDSRTF